MAEEMNGYTPVEHKEYASNSQSNLNSVLGALGTASFAGINLANLLGVRQTPQQDFISRREAELMTENALLKANQDASDKLAAYKDQQNAINMKQVEVNAYQAAAIQCAQKSIDRLYGSFRLMMPNDNIAPGWGPSFYSPFPPVAPTASNGGTVTPATSSTNG